VKPPLCLGRKRGGFNVSAVIPLARNTLPANERAFRESVEAYLRDCEQRGLELDTRKKYASILRRYKVVMERDGYPYLPKSVSREGMWHWKQLNSSSKWNAQQCVTVANSWLGFHGNSAAMLVGIRWGTDERQVGRWLSFEEKGVIEKGTTGWTRWAIHCGFRLLLRRNEWRRLRVEDVDLARRLVHVRGKGKKQRSVPFSASTGAEFEQALQLREGLIARHPTWACADSILLTPYRGELRTPQKSTVDNWIAAASEEAGIPFSSHDMRRTGARHYYDLGMKVEAIQRVLGHSRRETTLIYLGLLHEETASEMARAEARELQMQETVVCPK